MSQIQKTVTIDAPLDEVWNAVSDVGYVHNWHPKVKASPVLSVEPVGVGATRRCDFHDGTSVVEKVTAQKVGEFLEIELSDFSMPLSRAEARIDLEALSATRTEVRFQMDYDTKYGPMGWLMDVAMIQPMMDKMFDQVLGGLSHHVRTGEYIGEDGPVATAA